MSKLQYVLRASPAYLCREELRIFVQGTFWFFKGSGERVLEGDVRKQAVFPVSFCHGGLGCKRAGDILHLWTMWMSWWKLFFLELT